MVGVALFLAFVGGGCKDDTPGTVKPPDDKTLLSLKATTAPTMDASGADAVWGKAPTLTIQTAGGTNDKGSYSSTVKLKSVYVGDEIFFWAEWTDDTKSIERNPWVKQADGTWKQLPASTHYEDKMAFIWNINNSIAGFNDAGCAVTCHAGEGVPEGGDFGKKYTAKAGEIGDIWHWKSARTDTFDVDATLITYIDDQYVDNPPYDLVTAKEAGRHSDPGKGGYVDNRTDDKKLPKNEWKSNPPAKGTDAFNYLSESQMQAIADYTKYVAGDQLPGLFLRNPDGDRADLLGQAQYKNGKWELEWKRKLNTESQFDVQFTNMDGSYYFGVSNFNNSQVKHAYSSVYRLTFQK